ncbi:MAG TPA: cell envelope integrity protein TolA [Candidatus Limnocylindrales bacterium]|nr:cell envelope integrity protein TolA [Candidatus Limnocylindrales bacterium]
MKTQDKGYKGPEIQKRGEDPEIRRPGAEEKISGSPKLGVSVLQDVVSPHPQAPSSQIWSMIGVSLLLHILFVGIVLFAATYLLKQQGVIFSGQAITVGLVSDSDLGGLPLGESLTGSKPGPAKSSFEDIPKPEVKKASTETPQIEVKEPITPPVEKKDTPEKKDEVLPTGKEAKVKKDDPKTSFREVKDIPKVKDEPSAIAEKQFSKPPKKTEKAPARVTNREERSAVSPVEPRSFSVEEIREKRLKQMAEVLPEKRPPPIPTREPTPNPPEALPPTSQPEDNPSLRGQRVESSDGKMGGSSGSASLELGGDFQQGSRALVSYMESVTNIISNRWLPTSGKGRGIIQFTIFKSGEISDLHILKSSGDKNLDESILRAVEDSNPLPEFPPELQQELDRLNDSFIRVKFHFGRRVS